MILRQDFLFLYWNRRSPKAGVSPSLHQRACYKSI